jgi:hypothetical protein
MTPFDITVGESWGCKYRITKMLDKEGKPVTNLQIGETAAGPGAVEGIAVIVKRDSEKQLLELQDIVTKEIHIVAFADVWDIDRAVYVEDTE